MHRRLALAGLSAVLLVTASLPSGATAPTPEAADRAILDVLATKSSHEERTEELVQLAWLRDGVPGEISAAAERRLGLYGARIIPALRRALPRVRVDQTAAVVRTILVARESQEANVPLDFIPALLDTLWIGSPEAKRLAIPLLAASAERFSVLPMIDSALDDPTLTPDVIRALGAIGDDRARFYLEKMLHEGGPGDREGAAVALARLGGRAMSPLRDAVGSNDRDVRLAAIRALLPVASPDDLTVFYVYLTEHVDDDPATAQAVRAAASVIEEKLEAQRAADAASTPRDF